jgi:hypothetical protein
MVRWLRASLVLLCLFAAAPGTFAQDAPKTAPEGEFDESSVMGELYVTLSHEYAKVMVNGEDWEDHEFTGNGKKLVVRKLPRDKEVKVTLAPPGGELAPVEIVLTGADYKRELKKQGKVRIVSFAAKRDVKFVKAAPAPTEGEKAPTP